MKSTTGGMSNLPIIPDCASTLKDDDATHLRHGQFENVNDEFIAYLELAQYAVVNGIRK